MTGQNDSIAVGIPGSHGGGHIFFDGDFDFEGQVKAEVGNAEAADAEDFADQVAAVYNCAQGKGEIGPVSYTHLCGTDRRGSCRQIRTDDRGLILRKNAALRQLGILISQRRSSIYALNQN